LEDGHSARAAAGLALELEFGATFYAARVFVNGALVDGHARGVSEAK
jgi:hypothetical protein